MGIANSFTLETSSFGYSEVNEETKLIQTKHYSIKDMEMLGESLAISYLEYTIIYDKL